MRRAFGLVTGMLALAFGLLFLDVFATKPASGDVVEYLAMLTYAAATYGCVVATRRLFRHA